MRNRPRRTSQAVVVLGVTIVAFLAASGGKAEEEKWKVCSNTQAEYVLQVPESLSHSTAPGATACAYQTADGEFTVDVVVEGDADHAGESLEARMQKEMGLLTDSVTYKKKGDTWFVLSGVTADGTEYYRKLSTNGSRWVSLRITYPHSGNKKYDKWVTRMEKTFRPFGEHEKEND